jgi:protein TonB
MLVNKQRLGLLPVAVTLAVTCVLAACSKQEETATTAPTAQQSAPAPTPESVVSASVTSMGVDQLREAANKAYNDNRLYAPAGNNAMEYFLALRDKQPGDAAASSALSDLLPMVVSAAEQSIERDDFDEAKRLLALIGKADANHPALNRLKANVEGKEKQVAQRAEAQKLSAEEEAQRKVELAKQREADQKRLQEQQKQQAMQQEAAQRETALREQAERDAAQRAAAQKEAADREAAQRAAAARATQQAAARPAASNNELRVVSTVSPRFPPQAQRAGARGTVQVEFTVGTDGSVVSARVVSSDAPRQFQRDFEREALAAAKRWRFQPIERSTTTRRTISFE